MPLYEFLCQKCGTREEKIISVFKRNNKRCCPKCNETMIRLVGIHQSFIFKGSGFYETDYKKSE